MTFDYPLTPVCCAIEATDVANFLTSAMQNIYCPVDQVKLLAGHGINANAQDLKGNTPLHWVIKGRSSSKKELLQTMIKLEANVNLRNTEDLTCLNILCCSRSLKKKDIELAHLIIDAGAELELGDRYGKTPLLNAATNGAVALNVLLQSSTRRPSLYARTFLDGKTALHLACQSKSRIKLIEKLVSYETDSK